MPRSNRRRGAALGGAALAGLAFGACAYPDFQYVREGGGSSNGSVGGKGGDGNGGSGGDGAGAGGAGGQTAEAQVPCVDGTLCASGELCCYNQEKPSCDKCFDGPVCAGGGECASQYATLACDSDGDCQGGDVCCAQLGLRPGGTVGILSISCLPKCATKSQIHVCKDKSECESGEICSDVFAGEQYGYQWCMDAAL